jgi:hypothetical protein
MIHADRRFHLPTRHLRSLPPEAAVQWMWWDGSFDFEEVTIHGVQAQESELERFAQAHCPWPVWMYGLDRTVRQVSGFGHRVAAWAVRRIRRAGIGLRTSAAR